MDNATQVYYDEATGIVFNTGRAASTVEDARATLRRAGELMEGKPRRLLLVDLREAPLSLSSDVRETLMEESRNLALERQAFVVSNPVTRMLAKAIARVTGVAAAAAFFSSTEEAVKWLQEK
jgi:hypothetical protein